MPQLNKSQFEKAVKKAKRLGVEVRLSKRKSKKLDVYKNGKYFTSIGDVRYSDFLQHNDDERRRRFRSRFRRFMNKPNTGGYYAIHILW